MAVSERVASKLAYYESAGGPGVLGPRGWHCAGTYGSAGTGILVTPGPISPEEIFRTSALPGPAIHLSVSWGGTSGRFSVALAIARVFPKRQELVKELLRYDPFPPELPSGPYLTDRLTYRSDDVAEYVTPARQQGLGTDSRLAASGRPISGLVMLFGDPPNLRHLSLRLPPDLAPLTAVIIRDLERRSQREP